jgi:CMP-N-acetylneuraminic acid synthetase
MNIIAVVPMKLNNERLPNKNILPFDNGLPLCNYVLNMLLKVKLVDKVYVYCSDEKIKPYLPKDTVFIKRNPSLDSSSTSMNEVLSSFAKEVTSDIYILAHATAPFILASSIEKALSQVVSGEYDSSFSAIQLHDFIWKDNRPLNYDLTHTPRTQDLEEIYIETNGMYIFSRNQILNHNRRIGFSPYKLILDKVQAIDIDDEFDFMIANAIFQTLKDDYFH